MATFEPVDFDPYAGITVRPVGQPAQPAQPSFEPVDHDPFAKTLGQTLTGLGNSFETGAEKGAAGAIGALGDLTDLGAKGIGIASDYLNDKIGLPRYQPPQTLSGLITGEQPKSILDNIPRSADIQQHFNEKYRSGAAPYQAQTTPERYSQSTGEFLLNAAGGAGGLLRRAGQVLLPAFASETAGHKAEGTKIEPLVRFLGALTGGGVASILSRPGTTAQTLAKQLPKDISPQMVDQADALMQQASAKGIQLAWPEALSQVAGRPVMTNMMRHLEASPQTEGQMGAFFAPRPQQVENAARQELGAISPVNPAPSSIGPAVGRAAGDTISDVRGAINKASEPYYQAAEGVTYSPAEFRAIKAIPGFSNALKAVRSDPLVNWRVAHLPDESVGVLNEVKKHFDQAAQNSASKFNPAANQQVKASNEMAASAIKQINEAKSQDYGIALKIQQDAREKYLQPLLDGPLGKLAAKSPTTQKAIRALFPADPLANSEREIRIAVGALAKRNPMAASDLIRAHIEGVFNGAAKDLQTGANQAGGAKFRTVLIGNSQQEANLKAAVEELPGGRARWAGFKDFLDVLEATGTRQNVGSRTAYNAELNKTQSAGGLVRDATKIAVNPVKAFQPLVDKYEQYKLGKNLSGLANILTDPGAADTLKAISKLPKGSINAQMVALKLLTYGNASAVQKPNK